ncbi:flagellar hook-associated protein FlgK [Sphingomonas montana]|uniref:flagellar hook-associated protein FlgK n=1 Tax=Sphingomonas montana TaxID=1843236 RepID=UPI00096C7BC0|nr:flagellar hook-associated protein FlgK [Sphingomonas montana]
MNDLIGIGASGIRAYRTALSTVAENTANVDTPGYTRRQTQLKDIGATTGGDPYGTGSARQGGVAVGAIARVWDDFKAADARLSSSDAARAATRTEWLSAAETALPDDDRGVGAKLTAVFSAATALSAGPNDMLARQTMVSTLDQAATGIRTAADALTRVGKGIGDQADTMAQGINDDLTALGKVNLALARATPGTGAAASLADERDRLLDGLSERIGIDTSFDAKGAVTVALTGNAGTPLLSGGTRNAVAVERAADGRLALSVRGDTVVAVVPTGGAMAGLVDAARQVAGSRTALDGIAAGFAAQVNGWNAAGTTPSGAAGGALLAGTDAASLTLIAGVTGNAIAAGKDGIANGNAVAFAGFRGPDGAEARIESLIGLNAQTLSASRSEAAATATRSDSAFAARDAVSGVDLDREASDLLRYQQAYSASAKVLQTARDTLATILQLF